MSAKVRGGLVDLARLSGDVAQLVERLICIQEVTGSSPVISIELEMDGLVVES